MYGNGGNVSSIPLPIPIIGGTPGSVLFIDNAGNLGQFNPGFTWNDTTNTLVVGDPGTESGGITVNGVLYNAQEKVSEIGLANVPMLLLHRHSTAIEPLTASARSNSNTSAHADVTPGMALYSHYAAGWAGVDYKLFGNWRFIVDPAGAVSNTSAPGSWILALSPNGTIAPVDILTVNSAGQMQLATQGINGGVLIGGDTQIYRNAANVLRTPDAFIIDGVLTPSALVDISGAAAGQIKFPATQNPSADANTLDDYEKGTFTPIDASGAGLAFSAVAGFYTKIGEMCFIKGVATYPATANGLSAQIGGLPFTSSAASASQNTGSTFSNSANAEKCEVDINTTAITLFASATVTGSINSAVSGATIFFSCAYFTA